LSPDSVVTGRKRVFGAVRAVRRIERRYPPHAVSRSVGWPKWCNSGLAMRVLQMPACPVRGLDISGVRSWRPSRCRADQGDEIAAPHERPLLDFVDRPATDIRRPPWCQNTRIFRSKHYLRGWQQHEPVACWWASVAWAATP